MTKESFRQIIDRILDIAQDLKVDLGNSYAKLLERFEFDLK